MKSNDAGGGRRRRRLLDRLARIGLLPDEDGVGAPSSLNILAMDLHRYLPFLGKHTLRYRETNKGNASLIVLRMRTMRRATCNFDASTRRDEDKNKEDKRRHCKLIKDEASCVGEGKETGGGC